jgi:alkanesulfonate monooxygenase SsuD/methylene tetrahydromethanopterin reductase-like flavin-dependent oxidoreductase (luciferase family)
MARELAARGACAQAERSRCEHHRRARPPTQACAAQVPPGPASAWVRDAFATIAAQLTLAEAYPDRFLLGVGVSHRQLVENERGHRYVKPFSAMHDYLDRIDEAWDSYKAKKPDHRTRLADLRDAPRSSRDVAGKQSAVQLPIAG